jgi:hypothetical protein
MVKSNKKNHRIFSLVFFFFSEQKYRAAIAIIYVRKVICVEERTRKINKYNNI